MKNSATITNDFKNVSTRKTFKAKIIACKYNDGQYYRIFIDREDERRLVITLTKEEQKEFLKQITF